MMSNDTANQTPSRTSLHPWKALSAHYTKVHSLHLRQLFADDPKRGERFAVEGAGLYLDFSKNRITGETIPLLVQLAEACGLRQRIEAMWSGEKINSTRTAGGTSYCTAHPEGKKDNARWGGCGS